MATPDAPDSGLAPALDSLYRRNLHTVRIGLEPTRALLEALGRPQDAFLSVHIAGTNGKGSVATLLATVLQAAGLRTGLYTSPHLVRFNERIRVQGEAIPDDALAGLLRELEVAAAVAARAPGGRDVTFFEFTTALAFEHFRRQRVQVAVIETGLGGRLDATNVIEPLACAITSIGLDHQAHLGDTLEKIASEKAGILKPGRAVVCGALPPAALAVVRRQATALGCPLILAAEAVTVRRQRQDLAGQRLRVEGQDTAYPPVTLPLLGQHQLGNVAVAVALLEHLRDTFQLPLPESAVVRGLSEVRWPARFQLLEQDPPTVLDGAHNPQAAEVLADTLNQVLPDRPLALVAGFLSDKDAAGFLRALAGRTRRCWLVPLTGERAMPEAGLVLAARSAGLAPEVAPLTRALAEARAWAAAQGGAVCITGSLHLAGAVLAARGTPP